MRKLYSSGIPLIPKETFIWLTARSTRVFLALAKGSLNAMGNMMNSYERSLAAYSKGNPINGRLDEVRLRAVTHLAGLDKLMWRAYHEAECLCEKSGLICPTDGTCTKCHAEYAKWKRGASY